MQTVARGASGGLSVIFRDWGGNLETDIWGSPPTHGSGSRNRAMIASSRSRGGYRSVIRMAARGTANRTLPDDMGIAMRSNVQLWPAPPGRSIGARSVASSSDSPLEGAGFEPSVPPSKRRPGRGGPRPTTVVAGDALCLMTHPAYRSGISVRQQPRDPFLRAVPKVRIRFPPAESLSQQ